MVFGIPSHPNDLSLQQALELSEVYLDNADRTTDPKVAEVLCDAAFDTLSKVKSPNNYLAQLNDIQDQALFQRVADAYTNLSVLLGRQGHLKEALATCKKEEKWREITSQFAQSSPSSNIVQVVTKLPPLPPPFAASSHAVRSVGRPSFTIPSEIFARNVPPPTVEFKLPQAYKRLSTTPQLAYCLGLLNASDSLAGQLGPDAQHWLQAIEKDTEEQERLRTMATDVVRAFKRDELKDAKVIAEVVYLAPVLTKDDFDLLLGMFFWGIEKSALLNTLQVEGLARLIQEANPSYFDADNLVKILQLLSAHLLDVHQQSWYHTHQLTLAISHVLDAMADAKVTGLDRQKIHEPLSNYLNELKGSSDPFLVYQAAYGYQALMCVPDNESMWQSAMRRTGKVISGFAGIASAVKGLDLAKFIENLEKIQEELVGVAEIIQTAYEGVTSLAESGQSFLECLKESFDIKSKKAWYSALRGADVLVRNGALASFKKLVCEAPCRLDVPFQWGVCQRLGAIAANPKWDMDSRRGAVAFLGEIYKNDEVWGRQASIKKWILNILMQLESAKGTSSQIAKSLLQALETNGNSEKQALYKACRGNGPIPYPLKIALPELASSSLLDRVQNRTDVENNLRLLRRHRTNDRGNTVYVPPQAKASLQAAENTRFPLMEKMKEFLESEQKVFLLLGDSGSGKSTFNRELEFDLWQSYESKTGRIPLHIALSTIDKPEHDMIPKQLRKANFTEPQIRELKHRDFILICDGYDEIQLAQNLYRSNRLNRPGEWRAQMVISCRTEVLGNDYRDHFQPGDRNHQSEGSLFQEAVMTPFSLDQVHDYIQQYVTANSPIWRTEDYEKALELIPSLKDLAKNPFLMTLSLDVLPRMVDPGEELSAARVTRVALYDQFVEQWLERGKQRLEEKNLTLHERSVFENLSDDGFAHNGIDFMKKLAVAIYRKQGGQPVVEYHRSKDQRSWKDEFFSGEDKRLLREACPLTRNGNQFRFIHRSLLEYGLARAIFDPQDAKRMATPELSSSRRGSVSSIMSFEIPDTEEEDGTTIEQEPDTTSPLFWRNFVNDHFILQFLEERAQQEPVFKKQLLAYIEYSKSDKKWRTAAANAITILVRAGVRFIGTDLRGIQIPGADLSYGVFDSVQLQDADLRKVNLRGVWLRQTNLSRANMTKVQFGEYPFLPVDDVVQSCAYSSDGKLFAVGLSTGSIHVYATSNWEKVRTWSDHQHSIRSIAFSPTGNRIASSSTDKTARLWDVESGESQHLPIKQSSEVVRIAFSPQGDQVALVISTTVEVWDVATKDCILTLSGDNGHQDLIMGVVYSPDGQQIATAAMDHTVRIWDATTGVFSRELTGHTGGVWSVAYSPLGNQVASSSSDNTVRLWDVKSGECLHVLSGHDNQAYAVTYSPNGQQVASGGLDATVRLWDVESGSCRQLFNGHGDAVTSVLFSKNGDQIASGSADNTIRFWDVSTGTSRLAPSGHSAGVQSIKYPYEGGPIASGGFDDTLRLWDVETGACNRTLRIPNVSCLAYSRQGDQIASGGYDNSVRLWDVQSGTCQRTFTGHTKHVFGVAYSPRGDQVASASLDHTVRLWNVLDAECSVLTGHTNSVANVAYSPNGEWVASSSKDSTVRIWDVATSTCRHVLMGHHLLVWEAAFSPRGDQLASCSQDQTICLWNLETGGRLSVLTGHTNGVCCVAYSPSGDMLASGGFDKTIRLWDVVSGKCRVVIRNFQDTILGVAWLGEGQLVAGSADGSVLKWQIVKEAADQYQASLQWCTTNGSLNVTGASMHDVHGLTSVNKQLLKQRGGNLSDGLKALI